MMGRRLASLGAPSCTGMAAWAAWAALALMLMLLPVSRLPAFRKGVLCQQRRSARRQAGRTAHALGSSKHAGVGAA